MSKSDELTPESLRLCDELYLEPTREEGVQYVRSLIRTGRIDHVPESLKFAPWDKTWRSYQELTVKDSYDEIFAVELEGWCYGIQNYPGEIFPGLVYRVIKEMRDSWAQVIRQNVLLNLPAIARCFAKASKYLVPEREIALCILSTLPAPASLDEEGQYMLALLIDQAEQTYGGIHERLERKWNREMRKAA